MSHLLRLALIVGLFTVPLAASASPTASCTARCANKDGPAGTQCVAPAFVHVDCVGNDSVLETTDSNAAVRPFHDLHYKIEYGDEGCSSGQGTWTYGYQGALKNVDYTPLGAHVYECEGLKTITTTVTDSAGNTSTTTDTVTIIAENTGWTGANTRCVACGSTPQAGVGGCPTGTTSLQNQCNFATAFQLTPGKRTLYKCGDSFTVASNIIPLDATSNGSLVAGYGDCTTSPVLVTTNQNTIVANTGLNGGSLSGWRFRDIRITSSANGVNSLNQGNQQSANSSYGILLLRIDKRNMAYCADLDKAEGSAGWNTLSAVVSSHCELTNGSTTLSTWNMGFGYSILYGAYINNFWEATATVGTGVNMIRTMGLQNSYIGHSTLSCASHASLPYGGCAFNIRAAPGEQPLKTTRRNVVNDWHTLDNGGEGSNYLSIQTHHGGSGLYDTLARDYLIDGFFVEFGSAHDDTRSANFPFETWAPHVTFRNIIYDTRATPSIQSVRFFQVRPNNTPVEPHDVDVFNATWIRGTSNGGQTALGCATQGSPLRFRCRNLLVYDDDGGDTNTLFGSCVSGCTTSDSEHLHLTSGDCPFYGATGTCDLTAPDADGTDPLEFRLRTDGLGNVGTVLNPGFAFPDTSAADKLGYVYTDAILGCRGADTGGPASPNAAWDIGAFEAFSDNCYLVAPPDPEPDPDPRLQGVTLRGVTRR